MAHLVPGLLTAFGAGRRGLEADRLHLLGPLAVVVATPPRLTVVVLPEMNHFVNQRREGCNHRVIAEVGRVEGDFIAPLAVGAAEAVAGEVAVAPTLALERDQTVGQNTLEELLVEDIVGELEPPVGLLGWLDGYGVGLAAHCNAHSNSAQGKKLWMRRGSLFSPVSTFLNLPEWPVAPPRGFLAVGAYLRMLV